MNNFTRIFSFFFREYRRETVSVVLLIILAGLFEALGVAAFLPFLQVVLEGNSDPEYLPGPVRGILDDYDIRLTLGSLSVFIASVITFKALVLWFSLRKVSITVARISADLRRRLLEALLKANWRFFVDHSLGTSLNAIINETYRSSMAFVSLARFCSILVQFMIYAVAAFLLSWKIFLGATVIGAVVVSLLWFLVHIAHRAGQLQTDLARDMLNQMAEMLQGIKPLRAMALEKSFMIILSSHSGGLEKSQSDQLVANQTLRVFHEPLMVFTAIAGLYFILAYGELSSSALALMAVVFIRLLTSMNAAQTEYQRIVSQESALWSLLDTIRKTEQAVDIWPGSDAVPEEIKEIEFRNVDFFHGERGILRGADLLFLPRQMTALIGESGSGKTTILDLLCGFYLPDSGSITVSGRDLSALDLREWRKAIGFVPQDVFLFNDFIIENIRVGRGEITEEAVWRALENVGAKDFVENLPDRLSASVGENGRRLSGGQRQRIAIARAIVHQPQILLLDEATSALDRETEQVLLQTLKQLSRQMTVIFVSHNLVVQDYADIVYRIEGGKAVKYRRAA